MNEDNKLPDQLCMLTMLKIKVAEKNPSGLCIWCGKSNKKNNAHILSKKIIKTNKPNNYLKKSVCEICNSFFGTQIEDWFYKYSPMATWATQLFKNDGPRLGNLKHVPNFIWVDEIKEWIVVNHYNTPDILATQLILPSDGKLTFCHHDRSSKMTSLDIQAIYDKFWFAAIDTAFTTYLTDKLPDKFSSRLFIHENKVIVIARDEIEKVKLVDKIISEGREFVSKSKSIRESGKLPSFSNMHIHYRWSIKRYMKLCAKIGFEFLSMIEGSDFCLDQVFERFRSEILNEKRYDNNVIPYEDGKGYSVGRFTAPGWLAYCDLIGNPGGFPPLFTNGGQRHKIFLYEIKGFVLLTVQLFDMQPCQLVIGKCKKLERIYYIEYDFAADTLEYYYTLKNLELQSSDIYREVTEMVDKNKDVMKSAYFYDFADKSLLLSE